jgi:hypothetical protein
MQAEAKIKEAVFNKCPSRNGRSPIGDLDNLFEIKARTMYLARFSKPV